MGTIAGTHSNFCTLLSIEHTFGHMWTWWRFFPSSRNAHWPVMTALHWYEAVYFLFSIFHFFVDLLVLVMRQIGRASQTRAENERETTTIPSKIVFYLKRKCNNNGNVFPNGQMNGGHPMCVCVCGRSPHEYCTWGNLNILSWLFVFAFDFFSLFSVYLFVDSFFHAWKLQWNSVGGDLHRAHLWP